MPSIPDNRITARLVIENQEPVGVILDSFDESVVLEGYKTADLNKRLQLAPSAEDVSVTFQGPGLLVIQSRDYPFGIRMAAGETLLSNLRHFSLGGADLTASVHPGGSVLLYGNGENVANLFLRVVESNA